MGAVAHDGPTRRPSGGRLGALAAITPVAMYLAWNAIAGWGGDASEFALATAQIILGAVAAGWIVGGRVGRSIPGHLLGLVAYGFVGRLVLLPLGVAASTWGDVQAGLITDVAGVFAAVGGYLVYGFLASTYVAVYLLPFGAAWIVTLVLLRRVFDR